MTEYQKAIIKHSRLLGEYTGTLKGILHWDIPSELREKIEILIKKLEAEPLLTEE